MPFGADTRSTKDHQGRTTAVFRCDSVIELTDELKSSIALPAITRRIVAELIDRTLEGWNLERMRANKILDFNEWSVQSSVTLPRPPPPSFPAF